MQILGKVEWVNPGGSIKDRAAASIVLDAEKRGLLRFNQTMITTAARCSTPPAATPASPTPCWARRWAFPSRSACRRMSREERKHILAAYGAEVIWTDPADGSDGAIRKAREMIAAEPDRYFYADQYGNAQNWRAHYRTTANEIWQQTEGQVTHFVAGLGTSGTFMGTTRRLKELNPAIQCISMQPDSPFNGFEGLKHMATAIVPPIYDATLADANIFMETETRLRHGARAGPTRWPAGRRLRGGRGRRVAADRRAGGATPVARPSSSPSSADSADKYLSERFWREG